MAALIVGQRAPKPDAIASEVITLEIIIDQQAHEDFKVRARTPSSRTGVHLSDLTGECMRRVWFGRVYGPQGVGVGTQARFDMGYGWEGAIMPDFMAAYTRRGVEVGPVDDVVGTLDGWDEKEGCVVEAKLTWKSAAIEIWEQWWWFTRMKGYFRLTGTTQGKLAVVHINGYYTRPPINSEVGVFEPVVRFFRVQASEEEIEDNWRIVLGNKVELEEAMMGRQVLPGARLKGMCTSCPFKDENYGTIEDGKGGMGFKRFPCDGLVKVTSEALR